MKKKILIKILLNAIKTLKSELAYYRAEHASVEAERDVLNAKNEKLRKTCKTLKAERDAARTGARLNFNGHAEMRKRLEALKAERNTAIKERKDMEMMRYAMRKGCKLLEAENAKLREMCETLEAQREHAENKRELGSAAHEDMLKDWKEMVERCETLEAQRDSAQRGHAVLTDKWAAANKKLSALEAEHENVLAERDAAVFDTVYLRDKIKTLEAEHDSVLAERAQLRENCRALKAQNKKLVESTDMYLSIYKDIERDLKKHRLESHSEIEAQRTQIESLTRLSEKLDAENTELKTNLSKLQNKTNEKIK